MVVAAVEVQAAPGELVETGCALLGREQQLSVDLERRRDLLVQQERQLPHVAVLLHVQVGVELRGIGRRALRPLVVERGGVLGVATGRSEHQAAVGGERGVEVVDELAVVRHRLAVVVGGRRIDDWIQLAVAAVRQHRVDVERPGRGAPCREGDELAVPRHCRASHVRCRRVEPAAGEQAPVSTAHHERARRVQRCVGDAQVGPRRVGCVVLRPVGQRRGRTFHVHDGRQRCECRGARRAFLLDPGDQHAVGILLVERAAPGRVQVARRRITACREE